MMHERLDNITAKYRAKAAAKPTTITVCVSSGCQSAGSEQVRAALEQAAERHERGAECHVKGTGCRGLCSRGPLVAVAPTGSEDEAEETLYQDITPDHAEALLSAAFGGDTLPDELHCPTAAPFFSRQQKIVLANSGYIDPESIDEYIAHGGYRALVTAVTEMEPVDVVEEVTRSGLRGRGGGGYPTGLKWVTVAKADGDNKVVICNGDEGDPGAFMDRSVMDSDPHRVLEGMAIAAYAVGATEGYIYVRGEYPLAAARLEKAIRQARRNRFLGQNICGTTFDFNVSLRLGGGAFVCGEETALIASIEGRRGTPRPRPPYPAEVGLWGRPTLINNVETFANIAPIIEHGGDWYASIGTAGSKGTKVFALAGSLVNTGLIEVPMGMKLRDIVFDIGGGVPNGGACKAIQTGGPSGGCIPESLLDTPVDYESLKELGSMMGSGGMIAMDSDTSMIEVAHFFMEFCVSESCGKCIPCRTGTVQMAKLLEKFMAGTATAADLTLLEELCDVVRNTSLCGLGQSAPNPVLSTLRYFRHEYEEQLQPSPFAANGRHNSSLEEAPA